MNRVHDIQEHIVSNNEFSLQKSQGQKKGFLAQNYIGAWEWNVRFGFYEDFVLNLLSDIKYMYMCVCVYMCMYIYKQIC